MRGRVADIHVFFALAKTVDGRDRPGLDRHTAGEAP